MKQNNKTTAAPVRPAFSLIELLGIMSIIGIIVGIITYPMLGWIEQQRLQAERAHLDEIKKEIEASFFQDYKKNISAIPNATDLPQKLFLKIGGTEDVTTVFDRGIPATNENFNGNSWYAKLAVLRGATGFPAGVLSTAEGSLRDVAYNMYGTRRMLIAGPYDEPEGQRYLLLSLMFSRRSAAGSLAFAAMPDRTNTAEFKAWFDHLYNFDWRKGDNTGDLIAELADGDINWVSASSSKLTYAQRVLSVRIVQPRFRIWVNSTSTDDGVDLFANVVEVSSTDWPGDVGVRQRYLYNADLNDPRWNGSAGTVIDSMPLAINPGTFPLSDVPGILAGRMVTVRDKNLQLKLSFPIDANKVITYQNGVVADGGPP